MRNGGNGLLRGQEARAVSQGIFKMIVRLGSGQRLRIERSGLPKNEELDRNRAKKRTS